MCSRCFWVSALVCDHKEKCLRIGAKTQKRMTGNMMRFSSSLRSFISRGGKCSYIVAFDESWDMCWCSLRVESSTKAEYAPTGRPSSGSPASTAREWTCTCSTWWWRRAAAGRRSVSRHSYFPATGWGHWHWHLTHHKHTHLALSLHSFTHTTHSHP